MKKHFFALAAAAMVLSAAAASAEPMGGLGFHAMGSPFDALFLGTGVSTTSPTFGVRQWFSDKVGVDVNVGWSSVKDEPSSGDVETFSGWAAEIGIPISLKSWDKVNFLFRPGISFGSLNDKFEPVGGPTSESKLTLTGFTGELEVEYMLAEKVSISAAQGIGWATMKDDQSPENKFSHLGLTGNNFTQLGFHVYLW